MSEYPTVNLPQSLRQRNWLGTKGEGSCVHATLIMLLRWQGRYATADRWRRLYGNGEYADQFAAKLTAENVRFAMTTRPDVRFLDWACRTRRGCGITCMGGVHMVALVHLDNVRAGILDNNYPEKIKWVPRAKLINEWFNSRHWAITPVYTPAPPLPR